MAHSHAKLIGELTDDQVAIRSALMRLYHSRVYGDWYYPAGFVNGQTETLLAAGWMQAAGEGWRMTEAGIRAWAEMVKPLLLSSNHSDKGQNNELKAYAGLPIRRMQLEQHHRDYLARLAAAGGTLPIGTYDPLSMGKLVQVVYIVLVGEVVEMTVVGWGEVNLTPSPSSSMERGETPPLTPPRQQGGEMGAAFGENEEDAMKTCTVAGCENPRMVSKSGKQMTMCETHMKAYWREHKARSQVVTAKPRESSVITPYSTNGVSQADGAGPVPTSSAVECVECAEGCVYREVLDILRDKYPKVDELVEVLLRARAIRDELGI